MNPLNYRLLALKLVGVILLGSFCAIWGLMVAVLPMGLVLRGAFFLLLASVLVLAWMLRSKTHRLPPKPVAQLLLITIALSILWPRFILFPAGGISINPQSLTLLLAVGSCVVILVSNARLVASDSLAAFGLWKLGWILALWIFWRFLSSFLGENPAPSVLGVLKELLFTISFALLTATLLTYPDAERWLLKTIVLCGFIAALYGLAEAFLQKNHLTQFASAGGNDLAGDSLRSIASEKIRDGVSRAQSVFTHPIVFAQFIAALLPLALLLAIVEKKNRLWRVIGVIAIPIGILAIIKSGSRSGLVSILASMGFMMFIAWLRALRSRGVPRIAALLGAPILLISLAIMGQFVQELAQGKSSMEAGSTLARIEMLNHGLKALSTHPLLGYGHGASLFVAGLTDSKGLTSIDSHLLSLAIDSGYPGLAIFLIMISALVFKLASLAAKNHDELGLGAGMIAASIMALLATFVSLSTPNNLTLLWILFALGLFYAKKGESAKKIQPQKIEHQPYQAQ